MAEKLSKRRRKRTPRYLIRRDTGDFGPYTVNEIREAIEAREVHLGTEIQEVGGDSWQPAGVFTEFRDYYATCIQKWENAEIDRSVAAEESKMRTMGRVKSGAWKLIVVGILVAASLGSWIVYRVMHAEPTGIDSVVVVPEVSVLPDVAAEELQVVALSVIQPQKVKRLFEAEYYNTAGVRSVEREGAADQVMDLSDEAAGLSGIDSSDIARIKKRNQSGIERCMSKALRGGATFTKALVTYWIRSGKITDITVNKPAISNGLFVSCVRKLVRGTKVPTFAGQGRRLEHRVRVSN